MQVIATAGHVDHGKSTLVRALTGMEPDRWAEERRRGLTIDLGYAWLTLPTGERVAFVDVPGHERFVPNMLAGVGPVPAVLFVVAADEGWMPQSQEHLAAVSALGISRGLLAITRADLADPGPALRSAVERIGASSLGAVESVAVSAVTGQGLPELLAALTRLVSALPAPDPGGPVRLWVDRAFSIRGSGTVVTGTLPAGTVRVGDTLLATPSQRTVRVRALQSMKETVQHAHGVARVALNLRGVEAGALGRGMALVTPAAWTLSPVIDVRLGAQGEPPGELTLHIGAARTTARVRVLSGPAPDGQLPDGPAPDGPAPDGPAPGGAVARLTLRDPLPFHVGDRVLLRMPGAAPRATDVTGRPPWPPLTGATVLDVAPPSFTGRGAATRAGHELTSWPEIPTAEDLIRRRGLVRAPVLLALGASGHPAPVSGDWLADPAAWGRLRERLVAVVAAHAAEDPLAAGMPVDAARAALGVPDRRLVAALAGPELEFTGGLLRAAGAAPAAPAGSGAAGVGSRGPGTTQAGQAAESSAGTARVAPSLPQRLLTAVRAVRDDLAAAPFRAPESGRLRELGLDGRSLAAAGRAGLLLRVSDDIVLAPGADEDAARILARLAQPFTTAQARQALETSRRVAIPLLEYLDRAGVTQRLPDDRRRLSQRPRG